MPHKASILIVDDELEIRDALSRHFRLRGDDVVTANDVDAAEKALATRWFDVVVSDILMPGRSGTDLLSVLGEEYPMTHAIMITGYVTVENAMCCMRRGYLHLQALGKLRRTGRSRGTCAQRYQSLEGQIGATDWRQSQ